MPRPRFTLLISALLIIGVAAPIAPDKDHFFIPAAHADGDGGDGDGGDGGDGDGGDGDGGDGDGDGGDGDGDGDGGDGDGDAGDNDGDDGDDGDSDDDGDQDGDRDDDSDNDNDNDDDDDDDEREEELPELNAQANDAGADFAEAELVALGLTDDDLAELRAQNFIVIETTPLPGIGGVAAAAHLRAPHGVALAEARRRVRALSGGRVSDFNHYYRPERGAPPPAASCGGPECGARRLIDWPEDSRALARCLGDVTIGMIDTGLNADHAAFIGADLLIHHLGPKRAAPSHAAHGTAVAALLVGSETSRAPGLLPRARLVAVDAFHRAGPDERADLFSLLEGLSYLSKQGVDIINLSLAGPPNTVLRRALDALSAAGVIPVAATGNAGASAPPQFPAAYDSVIAVTAVDRDARIYRRAGRGPFVDFAAPGVDIWTAASISGARWKTGTSFAAPFVTAAIALIRAGAPGLTAKAARERLAATSRDLGEPGRDPIYGFGLVSLKGVCD